MSFISQFALLLHMIFIEPLFWQVLIIFFPFLLVVELPFYLIMLANIFYSTMSHTFKERSDRPNFPLITCVISAYKEGVPIQKTLYSLHEQLYPGPLEIIVVLDDPTANNVTGQAVLDFIATHPNSSHRNVILLAKKTRGGHASSLNLGLKMAKGEYLLALDGDSSCDNDLLAIFSEHFADKNVVGWSGTLRVRNAKDNLLTRLQAIEYSLGIGLARLGLSNFKTLNIISGAFGLFRRDFLLKIGGWKNGSAEDLDLTLRIQAYFHDHPELKLEHDSRAIVHTDVPTTFRGLLKQRLRWEGDLFFIYCRRHWRVFRPRFLGWRLFIALTWYGLLLHMVLPITLLFYVAYLVFTGHALTLLLVFALGYIYYLILTSLLFLCYVLVVSERKSYDFSFMAFLLFMPLYQLLMRLWAGISLLSEIVLKTHLDTTMAPYWVVRKADKD